MIGEGLINLCFGILRMLFSGLEFISLPTQALQALETIAVYGVWVVGVDVMALFVGSIILWWGVHLSIGLAVWLWKMLPLT